MKRRRNRLPKSILNRLTDEERAVHDNIPDSWRRRIADYPLERARRVLRDIAHELAEETKDAKEGGQ